MPALVAQLFAFHLAWGAPPPPPVYYAPPPAIISPRHATFEALSYCRDLGFSCRPDGARLLPGGVWRVHLDVKRRHHGRGTMVLDVDGRSGAVRAVYDARRRDWW
ncbi:MAG TPA: hypothetical protein VG496_05895 [Myxococcales bacterium]|nr:hypothetical protein [Myxococcales bacterium]